MLYILVSFASLYLFLIPLKIPNSVKQRLNPALISKLLHRQQVQLLPFIRDDSALERRARVTELKGAIRLDPFSLRTSIYPHSEELHSERPLAWETQPSTLFHYGVEEDLAHPAKFSVELRVKEL